MPEITRLVSESINDCQKEGQPESTNHLRTLLEMLEEPKGGGNILEVDPDEDGFGVID